ncbi:MAG: glycosyltransferase [Chromatiales bacterium]|nr:glycosyltransferase [Chromatiales bacterium]
MTKVSLITVAHNSAATIRGTIESVLAQDYPDIEHIVIDGASTDGTAEIVRSYGNRVARFVSEPDQGIYEAMNKGLRLAGGDIIGILNSDDLYTTRHIISEVVDEFRRKPVELVFGDIVFVNPDNLDKVIRYYSSASCGPGNFAWGWMPAHPSCFLRREVYEKYGYFKPDYRIAADFEILARFMVRHGISYSYIPRVLVKMRTGGVSSASLRTKWILNRELARACRENGIATNMPKLLLRYFRKVFQLLAQPGGPSAI